MYVYIEHFILFSRSLTAGPFNMLRGCLAGRGDYFSLICHNTFAINTFAINTFARIALAITTLSIITFIISNTWHTLHLP